MSEPNTTPPQTPRDPSAATPAAPSRPGSGPGGTRASDALGASSADGPKRGDGAGGAPKHSPREMFGAERDHAGGSEDAGGAESAAAPGRRKLPGTSPLGGAGGEGGAASMLPTGNGSAEMANDAAELLDPNTSEQRRAELIAEGAAAYAGGDVGRKAMKAANKNEDVQLAVHSTYKLLKIVIAIPLVLILGFGFILANSALNNVGDTLSGKTTAGGIHEQAKNKLGPAIEEYMQAGEAYNVPWTVIAALATGASESGKFSPYDAVDRDPHRKGLRRPSSGTTLTAGLGSFVPAGSSRLAWAQSLAQAIGANNEAAVRFLVAWSKYEQKDPLKNNPIATSEDMPGAVSYNSHGVKRYPDPATGLQASIKNLTGSVTGQLGEVGRNGIPKGYPAVVMALRIGDLDAVSAAIRTRDPVSKRQYCAGECAMYREGGILKKAARYLSDPGQYQKEGGEQILSGIVGPGIAAGPPAPGAGSSTSVVPATLGTTPIPVSSVGGPALGGVSVTVVGDSSCAGPAGTTLASGLRGRGALAVLVCRDARQLAEADGALNGYLTPATGVLVISLGTDETTTLDAAGVQASLEALVTRAGGLPVLIVTPAPGRPATAGFQAAASALAAAHPGVKVVDATTPATPAWVDTDGLHLSNAGSLARSELIGAAVAAAVTTGPGGVVVGAANPTNLKVSSFPVARPAIGGQPGEGVGPFLLRPSVLIGTHLNPQSLTFTGTGRPRSATDWVARALSREASRLKYEGVSRRAKPEAFWAEVMRRLPIMDPRNPECRAPEVVAGVGSLEYQQQVAAAIRGGWACELARAEGLVTVVGLAADGTPQTATGYDQQSLLVREALQVAWAYSRWGSASCDDKAPLAGVFPLTKAIFDTYVPPVSASAGRCNPGANIAAAVRAFIAGESVPVGTQRAETPGGLGDRTITPGPYNPLVGGWAAMPWVLGEASARAALLAQGPQAHWIPDAACLDAIDAWVLGGPKPVCGEPSALDRVGRSRGMVLYQQLSSHRALLAPTQTEGDLAPPVVPTDPNGLDRRFTVVGGTDLAAATALSAQTEAFLAGLAGTPSMDETRGGTDVVVPRLHHTSQVVIPATTLTDQTDYASALAKLARDIGGLAQGDSFFEKIKAPFEKLVQLFGGGSDANQMVALPESFPDAAAFNSAGQLTGLDPRMLAAVSDADPDRARAVEACRTQSGAGPQGVMVLQPATAQRMGVNPCDTNAAVFAVAKLLAAQYSNLHAWESAWIAKKYSVELAQSTPTAGIPGAREYVQAVAARWAALKEQYPSATVALSGSGAAVQAVNAALGQLGKPYIFASRGPNSFDCSGLMNWSYKQVGINVPAYTGAQVKEGVGIADYHDFGGQGIPFEFMTRVAAPGDLLLFKGAQGSLASGFPGHVGMYIGNGKMVHAPSTGDVVKVVELKGRSDLMYIRRMATG